MACSNISFIPAGAQVAKVIDTLTLVYLRPNQCPDTEAKHADTAFNSPTQVLNNIGSLKKYIKLIETKILIQFDIVSCDQ